MQALSGLLWREREALELLLGLLVATGDEASGLDDVELLATTRHALSMLELERVLLVRDLADELTILDPTPTLAQLASAAEPGWAAILTGHGRALQALVFRLDALVPSVAGPSGADASADALQRSLAEFLA